jgi:transcriptional regulator with XRE-family HTH domain
MSDAPESIGERVRWLREARAALTRDETLARCTLSRLENGHRVPGTGIMRAIAEALGVSLEYLLGADEGGRGDAPAPSTAYVTQVRGRLDRLPPGVQRRAAGLLNDLLDMLEVERWAEQAQKTREEGQSSDLGFDLDFELDEETRVVVWEVLEPLMRSSRALK